VTNPDNNFLPTGTITFTDLTTGTTLGSSFFVGSIGPIVRSITVSTLTAGSHNVQASFSGGVYIDVGAVPVSVAASDSNIVSQVVNKIATSTAVVSSPNPSAFAQSVTFTATVTPSSGGPATGTVTFVDTTTGTTLGSPSLDGSGQATLATAALGTGPHTVTATYNGDATFATSSGSVTQTVNQTGTSVALVSSANPSSFGQAVTFTATVTSGAGTPTGTVTFLDGATTLGTATLSGNTATFSTSSLAAGSHSITASYGGDANFAAATSPALSQTVGLAATSVTLASSVNPSNFGQAVTFTATVTGGAGTPTGTVTFRDGAVAIGTASLANGIATFTTSSLSLGTHQITASYAGNASYTANTSAVLTQAVQVPADSTKLRALQIVATKLIAQGSGQAITGAIDSAIGEGFSDGGAPFTMSPTGMRFNFAAESRFEEAFSALAYQGIVRKAPPYVPPVKDWLPWLEIRGTGWDVDVTRNALRTDITGTQLNALAGLTRRLTSDLLLGAFGGYETFDYTSQTLAGRLKGDGWTVGGYFGWRLTTALRFDASFARSAVNYEAAAGTAAATFPGTRWLASAGFTGTHRAGGFEIEPSLRAYALWEHENGYVDTLGTVQAERSFTTGRASSGVKVAYPLAWNAGATVAPYAGVYVDYYFSKDDATALLLPAEVLQGWSARIVSGVSLALPGGAKVAVGGEVGGLGGDFLMWTVRGRASVPF
jgi:hypothetical protein